MARNLPGSGLTKTWQAGLAVIILAGWLSLLSWQTLIHFKWSPEIFLLLFKLDRFAPFEPQVFFPHWLSTLKNLLLLIAFMLSAHGWGRILLEKIFPAARTRLDEMLYSLGLGLALISLLVFLFGVAGLYNPTLFAVVFTFLTGAGTWITWKRRARLRPGSGWLLGTGAWSDKILLILVVGFFLLVGMTIITPEIFFDSLVYHLAVPSQWIQAGRIHPIPTNFYSNLPMGIHMLYTGALMLSDERLCRMLHALLGILAGLTTFSLGRRWFGRRTGLWAAGLFWTTPIVIINMQEAGVDVGSAFFAVLAFHAILANALKQEGGKNQQIMAGLLTGAALAGKYTTAFMLMPGVLVVLFMMRRQGWKSLTSALVRISLGAAILMMPWVIKNIIFTNNPIYPFLYNYIPSKYVVPEKMQQAMGQIREYGHRTMVQFFRLPWDMTFRMPTSYSYVGPVFLMLFPGILLLVGYWRRGPPALGAVLLTVIFSALIWANRTQISRFYIPSLPLLAILGTYALDRWEQWHKVPAIISRWAILVFLGWGWANTMFIGISNWDPIGSALGLESRAAYLDRKLMNSYAPMARAINRLPQNARILAWGETRSFYFQRPVTASTVFDHNPLIELLAGSSSAQEVWQSLNKQGYTHIFIHSGEAVRTRGYETFRWNQAALERWRELSCRYLKRVVIYGQQVLYAVVSEPRMDRPVKRGRPLFTYDPDVVDKVIGHYRKAGIAIRQGRINDALAGWMRMIELAPEWKDTYENLGWLYLKMNRPEEAFKMYSQADELGWLTPAAYNNLGVQYLQHARYADARRCFTLALEQSPDLQAARDNLDLLEKKH